MIFFIRSGTQQSQQNDLCAQQRQGVFAVHMRVWVSSVYRCHPGYGSLNNIILTISLAFQVIHDFLYTIWNTTKPTKDLCAQQRQGVFAVHMRVWVSSVYRCHPGYGSLNNIILTISLAFQVIHDFLYTIWNTTKPTKWPMCQAKIEISLGICPVWSESPLSIWRFKSLATHIAHSKGSDSVATVGKIPGKWIFF